MMTYGDIRELWNLVLPWLLQAQPHTQKRLDVMSLFQDLAGAITKDTSIADFNDLNTLRDVPIGATTTQWLVRARPFLARTYTYFDHFIESKVNPTSKPNPP